MRRSVTVLGALALAALAAGTPAPAEPEAGGPSPSPLRAALRLMEAGHRVPYEGTQRTEMHPQGRRVSATARVAHLRRATRTEIQTPPRMRGMVILERGRQRLVRRPGKEQWHVSLGAEPPRLRHLLRCYAVALQGTGTIAGQTALIMDVRNRASGKPARKLWVDRQTGVVLRAEHYNWSGQLTYTTQFEEIVYSASPAPEGFRVPPDKIAGQAPQPVPPGTVVPKAGYVPAGFRQVGRPLLMRTRRGEATHLRFSDGLNAISVFVRKLQPGEPSERRPAVPPMDHPFSAVVHHVKGDLRITLIGDLSPSELQKMAESFE